MNEHSKTSYYQYKGVWISINLDIDWEKAQTLYAAAIELPNEGGVIHGHPKESRLEAEFSAEELIDSWN